MEGFWTANFRTPNGMGTGVAYFTRDSIYGGDNGFTYIGSYSLVGDTIDATLEIRNFTPGVQTVFGTGGQPFTLKIHGTVAKDVMNGQGSASHAPGMSFHVALKKVK